MTLGDVEKIKGRAPNFDCPFTATPQTAYSPQAPLRHTEAFTYRCYLPVLTGLGKVLLRRT